MRINKFVKDLIQEYFLIVTFIKLIKKQEELLFLFLDKSMNKKLFLCKIL